MDVRTEVEHLETKSACIGCRFFALLEFLFLLTFVVVGEAQLFLSAQCVVAGRVVRILVELESLAFCRGAIAPLIY